LLGSRWGEAVPLIQVLAVAAAVSAITSNNLSIYLALGRPHLASALMATRFAVLIIGLVLVGTSLGAIGVAWAELAAALASLTVSLPTLFTTIRIRVRDYLAVFWRPMLASAVMGWAIWAGIRPGFDAEHAGPALMQLLAGTALGCIVYPLAVAALWFLSGRVEAIEVLVVRRVWADLQARLAARRAS
jgi:PST family polysaccharide transporter